MLYTIKSKQIKHDLAFWLDLMFLVYELLLHFTYLKSLKGNNSHMESLDTFVSFVKIILKILKINKAIWRSNFVVILNGCKGQENKRKIVFGEITLTKKRVALSGDSFNFLHTLKTEGLDIKQ